MHAEISSLERKEHFSLQSRAQTKAVGTTHLQMGFQLHCTRHETTSPCYTKLHGCMSWYCDQMCEETGLKFKSTQER